MNKTYILQKELLMPGATAIILPVGYEVNLNNGMYCGEGGWHFAPHGVEDNKFHWKEKEENKSNDSFWNDKLVMELIREQPEFNNFATTSIHLMVQNFRDKKEITDFSQQIHFQKLAHTQKPQAEKGMNLDKEERKFPFGKDKSVTLLPNEAVFPKSTPQAENKPEKLFTTEDGGLTYTAATRKRRTPQPQIEVVVDKDTIHEQLYVSLVGGLNIPMEKLPAIKKAIEQVLNQPEVTLKDFEKWYDEFNKQPLRFEYAFDRSSYYKVQAEGWEKEYKKLYAQAEVMCEAAFNAAREKETLPQSIMRVPSIFNNNKYVNYEDYKSKR